MEYTWAGRALRKLLQYKFPDVQCVSTETVHSWKFSRTSQNNGDSETGRIVILDARTDEEHAVSHIIDAVRVHPKLKDVEKTVSLLKEYQQNGKQTVVCYCSVGYRGSTYAKALRHQLMEDNLDLENIISIYNMEGGLLRWADEKKPMVDYKNRPVIKVHPHYTLVGKLLLSDNIMTFNPDQ